MNAIRGTSAPIILVPGFWLGAWAWDEVAALPARATATTSPRITLPGWSPPTRIGPPSRS